MEGGGVQTITITIRLVCEGIDDIDEGGQRIAVNKVVPRQQFSPIIAQ